MGIIDAPCKNTLLYIGYLNTGNFDYASYKDLKSIYDYRYAFR